MPHEEDRMLTRRRRESAAQVASARESNRDANEHVLQSKRAIARSLDLLAKAGR